MNKWKKLIGTNLLVFGGLLLFIEFVLLHMGYKPGKIEYNRYFTEVDSLVMLEDFALDSVGIQHLSEPFREIANGVASKEISAWEAYKKELIHGAAFVGEGLLDTNPKDNELFAFIEKIRQKDAPDQLELAYLEYASNPVNKDGFRSIPFENHPTHKTKLFLLGDSFAYGHSASPLTKSFPDLLSSKGFAVYNSGISGADLPQYKAIAEKYISQVQPDFVIVNLFLGNDISKHDRSLDPAIPIYFETNAGNLYSCPQGITFTTAEEAYAHIISQIMIPEDRFFNKAMAKTRLGTKVWSAMYNLNLFVEHKHRSKYWNRSDELKIGYSINRKHLEDIQKICVENGSKLLVAIIPSEEQPSISAEEVKELVDGFPFILQDNLTSWDYSSGHFDNGGHRKYADFLEKYLE